MSTNNERLLTFGKGNAKLDTSIATFSIPAGHACPGALECMAKANRLTGKLVDGPESQFRCFSASAESAFRSVRKARWHNFELLKGKKTDAMVALILESLPDTKMLRIHVAGDFFNQDYFDAWLVVTLLRPDIHFYAYTKSLNFWVPRLSEIPDNFVLNASRGGRFDALIDKHRLKCAEVVFSEEEAEEKHLQIDHDDSHALKGKRSFALLLHGAQPTGSPASKALSILHAKGITGYPRKKHMGVAFTASSK